MGAFHNQKIMSERIAQPTVTLCQEHGTKPEFMFCTNEWCFMSTATTKARSLENLGLSIQPHPHDPVRGTLVDQDVAISVGAHVPDDTGIDSA